MRARTDTTLHGGREAGTVRRRLYIPSPGRSCGYDALTPRLDTPFSEAIGHCLAVSDPLTEGISRGGGGKQNFPRQATRTHSPMAWIPKVAMGPDHTHIRSLDSGDTRCTTLYWLQTPQSSEK